MGPEGGKVEVLCDEALLALLPKEKHEALIDVLSQDPRPGYQHDENRVYGISFAGFDVRFTVKESVLTVKEIVRT